METSDTDRDAAALDVAAPLRVLHCEDSPEDAAIIERMLRRWRPSLSYRRVSTEPAFRDALQTDPPEVVLCDYTVPGFGGMAALAIAREVRPSVPLIFISGTIGEDNAIESLRRGATDYVLKDRISRLIPAVSRALREAELQRREWAAAEAIAHHRRLLAAILAALPDFVYAVDRDNRIITCNLRTAELFRGPAASPVANALLSELTPPGIDMEAVAIENSELMREEREARDLNRRILDIAGAERYLNVSKTLIRDLTTHELFGLVAVARDVTDHLRLERAVLDASERERRRIGGDLHDGLGQELSGLGLLLAVVERSLPTDVAHALATLLRAQDVLRRATATSKRLAQGLAPVDLDREGLPAALDALVERSAEMFGIECRFLATQTDALGLDDDVAGHLYRIVQEAIGNSARHGAATRVDVRLVGGPQPLLEVIDNGRGFDVRQAEAGVGMGLRMMRYRASIIGCRISVESGARGTRIACQFLDSVRGAADGERY